jgi:hypothetical protein
MTYHLAKCLRSRRFHVFRKVSFDGRPGLRESSWAIEEILSRWPIQPGQCEHRMPPALKAPVPFDT